ncbi:cupin domain-containing protein [Winogradskyella tangerina]|uniref:cupin domain-containing protein n=1 Tax=Winogradskyella tangerina TaxID=2023240 RepID=UPI000DBE99B0|nr:cupin domain-containing protein [Winogradskyella tangerina]
MNYFRIFILTGLLLCFSCEETKSLPDPLEAGWKGEKVCELIEDNDNVRVLRCTFPPNVGHEKHYHSPHFGYALSGGKFRITDSSGSREVEIPTGFSFTNDEEIVHEAVNIGETTAVFLIIEHK